jgi:transglutaminase-like putative cysteine protease
MQQMKAKKSGHNYQLLTIPNGDNGTLYVLKKMRDIVRRYKAHPDIRELALSIVDHLPAKQWAAQAAAIMYWVRANVKYIKDPSGVEAIHSPENILKLGHGDCDDLSILYCSLAESIGHKTQFLAVKLKQPNGRPTPHFCHVLPRTLVGNRWFCAELTQPMEFGQCPRGIVKKLEINN